jgi:hypothetical protein
MDECEDKYLRILNHKIKGVEYRIDPNLKKNHVIDSIGTSTVNYLKYFS